MYNNWVNIDSEKYIPFTTAVHNSISALNYEYAKKKGWIWLFSCAKEAAVADSAVKKIPITTLKLTAPFFRLTYCQTTHSYIFQNS